MKLFDINVRGMRHHNIRAQSFFAACAHLGVSIGDVTSVDCADLPTPASELVPMELRWREFNGLACDEGGDGGEDVKEDGCE